MLTIFVGGEDLWNESTNEFEMIEPKKITLEHSLYSMSEWEAKYHKPFLSKNEKTEEEIIDYIRFMIVGDFSEDDIKLIDNLNKEKINNYIEDNRTATWFTEIPGTPKHVNASEQITSELIYYWMTVNGIPFECEKWHVNRLLTLIRVCNEKNGKGKKMSKRDIISNNASLNAARRKQLGSKG